MDRVHSMTGFAAVEGVLDGDAGGATFAWDARSVNNRALDLKVRLPAGLERLEGEVRRRLSAAFARGSIQVSLQIRRAERTAAVRVNEDLLALYLDRARRLEREHGLPPPKAEGLMALKGVLEAADEPGPPGPAADAALLAALDTLVERLAMARLAEGARLAATLSGHLDAVAAIVREVEALAANAPFLLRERLKRQVEALLEEPRFSAERLHQEAALLATRADVREEVDRLHAHVAAARDLLSAGGAIGRRLDFLSQEFNREANTVLSKAADTRLTEQGLALKARIEQMREQVQNVA